MVFLKSDKKINHRRNEMKLKLLAILIVSCILLGVTALNAFGVMIFIGMLSSSWRFIPTLSYGGAFALYALLFMAVSVFKGSNWVGKQQNQN